MAGKVFSIIISIGFILSSIPDESSGELKSLLGNSYSWPQQPGPSIRKIV
jgi:hypothetical protein